MIGGTMLRRVYIGHDSREEAAYRVCMRSIAAKSPGSNYLISPISSRTLGSAYTRPTSMRDGVRWDDISNAPMSTEFSIARFFIPLLQREGWALFCDCDFMWRASIEDVFAMADPKYAVMVVKHQQHPVEVRKMDSQIQTAYNRKNWSSLMLLNCSAPELQALSLEYLNTATKHDLHGFAWIGDDSRIGSIPQTWNWLACVNPALAEPGPRVVHYTLGTPDMTGYEDSPYAREWRSYAVR